MKSAILAVALAATLSPIAASADAAPVRHLVYSFTWGTQSDLEVRNSGVGTAGSGVSDFNARNGDQGSITVDVMREQPDKGLLVVVSEQAQKTRSSVPAKCVVYGTTAVICDPSITVNPEEMTVVRFLGSNFVDPAIIDAKQHWQISDSSGSAYSVKSDYTISKNVAGVMTIDEKREIKQMQPSEVTTEVNSTIGYDFNRTVPTSVDEFSNRAGGRGNEPVSNRQDADRSAPAIRFDGCR